MIDQRTDLNNMRINLRVFLVISLSLPYCEQVILNFLFGLVLQVSIFSLSLSLAQPSGPVHLLPIFLPTERQILPALLRPYSSGLDLPIEESVTFFLKSSN